MFAGYPAKYLKTSVQFFGLSLHAEDLLAGRGYGRFRIGDAEDTQEPIRPRRATADRAFRLALAERRGDHADGLERLQSLLSGQIQSGGLELALQGSQQQQGQGGDEEMGCYLPGYRFGGRRDASPRHP